MQKIYADLKSDNNRSLLLFLVPSFPRSLYPTLKTSCCALKAFIYASCERLVGSTFHIFCIFKNPTVSISNFDIIPYSFFHSSVYIPMIIDRTMSAVNVEATQNKTDRRTNETQAHTHTLSLSCILTQRYTHGLTDCFLP